MSLSVVRILEGGELDKMLDGSGIVRWETIPGCDTIEQWEAMLKSKPLGWCRNVSLTRILSADQPGIMAFWFHVDGFPDQLFGVKISSLRQREPKLDAALIYT